MNTITLSWKDWRAIIVVLREKGLDYMLEHAALLEGHLGRHGADEPVVTLALTEDVYHRSYTWAGDAGTTLLTEPLYLSL